MRLWRVSDHATLDGRGGLLAPGRWHHEGELIVYLAGSSALALLEILVRINRTRLPAPYQLLAVEVNDSVSVTQWPDGQDILDKDATRDWGSAFLKADRTAIARVPSSVVPESYNFLLNPQHPDAARVSVAHAARWPWDARLFGRGQGR